MLNEKILASILHSLLEEGCWGDIDPSWIAAIANGYISEDNFNPEDEEEEDVRVVSSDDLESVKELEILLRNVSEKINELYKKKII